jgi:NAD(P)-dependent dehydrogenase (short-subunit alcohol dehydrogenase family)/enamine deaminase RidA (YjgF/YER057c/UK114 family)
VSAPSLSNRRAVVTGGGRGIGAAIAEALAGAGASVLVAARSGGEIEGVASRLRAGGANAHATVCDATDEASVRRLGEVARERLGEVDLLVNNAGGAAASPLRRIALGDWNDMLAVNATSAFLCAREFAPAMAERGFGRIVNVASIAGLVGAKYIAHYAAAKHALVGLTRALAVEYAGTGVTANAVCPGYVDTPMTARTVAAVQARTGRTREAALAAVLASAGQRRLITPAEVADRVLALCAGATTGMALVVTGGETMDTPFEIVNPAELGAPKGWNNGVLGPVGGRVLFVAGQAGWESAATGTPPGFADQFARALDKVLVVVRAAGGSAQDIARLTLYVTDLAVYRANTKILGHIWRERFGGYYPAMALVEVKGLVDRGAQVEIEATAVLGGTR